MYIRICNHVDYVHESRNILYPYQYGFRAGHATCMPLLNIQEKITQAIGNSELVFLDLAKTFDIVDHKIVLNKLKINVMRGVPLNWFTSYLRHRQQLVKCHGLSACVTPCVSSSVWCHRSQPLH